MNTVSSEKNFGKTAENKQIESLKEDNLTGRYLIKKCEQKLSHVVADVEFGDA